MVRASCDRETIFDLVRHAHAHWKPDEARPLSSRGRQAARYVAALLGSRRPKDATPVSLIVSSPSARALQTVSPLAARLGLTVKHEPGLQERCLGQDFSDEAAFLDAVRTTWDSPDFHFPGGETNRAAQARGIAVIARLQNARPGEHMVVATHGNLMALMLQHFAPSVDYAFWAAMTMPDIYRVRLDGDSVVTIEHLWTPEHTRRLQ